MQSGSAGPGFHGLARGHGDSAGRAPDVLNHNVETVPRLYYDVRRGSNYRRSLDMLRHAKRAAPDVPTKSGMMLGLGESEEEVVEVMRDLRAHQVDVVTLGQYLRPSRDHLPIRRYYTPAEFGALKQTGEHIGFRHVEAGPLVRSSYHAGEAGL